MDSEFLNLYSSRVKCELVENPAMALYQNSSKETEENVSQVYDDMSTMKTFHSTEPFHTSLVPFTNPEQVTVLVDHSTKSIVNEHSTMLTDEKVVNNDLENFKNNSGHKVTLETTKAYEVNQTTTSKYSISELLKPLSEFTLPPLPQFGIKVVGAEVATPISEIKKDRSESFKLKVSPIFNSSETKSKGDIPS